MLEGVEIPTVAERHRAMLSRGIYTKSMVNSADRCQVAFGLSQGLVTGTPERELPGFALLLGVTAHDLLNLWALRTMGNLPLPLEEARQLLSERWDARIPMAHDAPPPSAKDDKIAALMHLWGQWLDLYQSTRETPDWTGKLLGTEVPHGEDGNVKLGGISIGGTTDIEFESAVWDAKIVGQKSPYRKPGKFVYELAHYAALTGKSDVAYVPFVHDLKTPKLEVASVPQTPDTLAWAGEKLDRFAHLVDAAKHDHGILQPPPHGVGTYPCMPKWCGYFGRQCPVTKHLKREDYQ